MQLQQPQPFVEIAEHAQDAIGVFAMKSVSSLCNVFSASYMKHEQGNVKYQVGTDTVVRTYGTNLTGLQNSIDSTYSSHALDKLVLFITKLGTTQAFPNSPFDAYAITMDLGDILTTSQPVVWTIGILRDPSINLTTASGSIQLRSSYYWSNFSTIADVVCRTFTLRRWTVADFRVIVRSISF